MNLAVFLDAGPLGLISNPRVTPQGASCALWLQKLRDQGARIVVPAIADYEVRRELLRARKTKGIARLNRVAALFHFCPVQPAAMQKAAEFWASARQQGRPTASDLSLDADAILAAQAYTFEAAEVIVATTNLRHLRLFVRAELWENILSV